MNRIPRYIQNTSGTAVLLDVLILGYIAYIMVRTATAGQAGMTFVLAVGLPVVLGGLLGPGLVAGVLVRHAAGVLKAMRVAWWVIIAFILAGLFNLVPVPWIVQLVLFAAVMLLFGLRFWILSDPRLTTTRER